MRLRYRLNFGEADLKANDKGLLSTRQRRNLWLKFFWQYIYVGYVIIFFGACSLGCHMMSQGYSTQEMKNAPNLWIFVGVFFLLPVLAIVWISQYEIYQDLRIDRVLRYKGFIYPGSSPWESRGRNLNPPEYWIGIPTDKEGPVRLDLTKRVFEAFVPGDAYIIYYTPKSKTLIAVEHLSDESPPPRGIPQAASVRPKKMTRRERRSAK